MHACTIIARNYLAHAKVLARTFREHHPDGAFTMLILDAEGEEAAFAEPHFDVVSLYDIGIPRDEVHRMAAIYDITEFATAVKPWLLETDLGLAVLLIEHVWAREFKRAVRDAGGVPLAEGFLTPELLAAVGAERPQRLLVRDVARVPDLARHAAKTATTMSNSPTAIKTGFNILQRPNHSTT